jgi:hypothetical protein
MRISISADGAKNAAKAVDQVLKNGPTTDATFFIVNRGEPPTEAQVRALGRVEPANPPRIGDVYLYRAKAAKGRGGAVKENRGLMWR